MSKSLSGTIRIPEQLDVPITSRVKAVLDSPPMQRLKRVSQLGLVSQVYPGAHHTRFEHSLGVYRLARHVLLEMSQNTPDALAELTEAELKEFLLAALLHDVGHWPYCHPIEDIRLDWIPRHESIARSVICAGELADVIEQQWGISPSGVADFLAGSSSEPVVNTLHSPGQPSTGRAFLQSILSGPVDIDKMDYLQRDSLHAGVPYGRNFDIGRLISSLRVGEDRSSLAISEKGKTAAEMMVFARYVMFSEVYWHHAIRSATAMLQRLVFSLSANGILNTTQAAHQWLNLSDAQFEQELLSSSLGDEALRRLSEGLFGRSRALYKRFGEFTISETPEIHAALARRPYQELVECSRRLAAELSLRLAHPLGPHDILLDAPPVKLEVQFRLPVQRHTLQGVQQVALADLSPVVKALATDQFDNFVKKVRVFVVPERLAEIENRRSELPHLLVQCAR